MPTPRPSPAATITVMEMMPQAMPNIVSIVRRLCAQSVASVSRSKSWNDMALRLGNRLLQDDLLLFVETFENLRLDAVGNAQLYAEFLLAVVSLGVGNFDRCLAFFVVDQRGFGNHQDVFLFLEKDLNVGAHVGFELAAGIGNRDAHFKRRDVVLLFAQRRNLGDLAGKFLIFERFHDDASRLTEKNFADVRFVYFALNVDFADVTQCYDQSSLRTENQDGADRIAHIYVAR